MCATVDLPAARVRVTFWRAWARHAKGMELAARREGRERTARHFHDERSHFLTIARAARRHPGVRLK